jgi:hypothetical protein
MPCAIKHWQECISPVDGQYCKQRKINGQHCKQRMFDVQYCKQRKINGQYCKQRMFDVQYCELDSLIVTCWYMCLYSSFYGMNLSILCC